MKTAVITGATSGLGKEIAGYYRSKGYKIITAGKTDEHNPHNFADQMDLANFQLKVEKTALRIDVLVNNAGALFLNEGRHNANHLYNLLLYTPYILMTIFAERMKQDGHIINIASVSGMMADPDTPMYGALKAGLISLTKSFAVKLAPNIRVNCISPGFFNTNLVPGDAPEDLLIKVPLFREAAPSEIIPVVEMLDQSRYMTGANIVIDGGKSA